MLKNSDGSKIKIKIYRDGGSVGIEICVNQEIDYEIFFPINWTTKGYDRPSLAIYNYNKKVSKEIITWETARELLENHKVWYDPSIRGYNSLFGLYKYMYENI